MSNPPRNPRQWPDPELFKLFIPSAKTAQLALGLTAFVTTCWLFLHYDQAQFLKENAGVIIGVTATLIGLQRLQALRS